MEKINYQLANKIKKHIKNSDHPLIIVISGVNGAGKTTLAFHLSNILEIKQRVGLGSIVKTLIVMNPKNKVISKMNNYFYPLSEVDIRKQAIIISKATNSMIVKYYTGGVSCIIEGVQLLTRYLDKRCIQFHIKITDSKKYNKQLRNSDTRNPRNLSEKVFENLLKVNVILNNEMNLPNVHILENSKSLTENINNVLKKLIINLNIK